jgi:hypothetical protein
MRFLLKNSHVRSFFQVALFNVKIALIRPGKFRRQEKLAGSLPSEFELLGSFQTKQSLRMLLEVCFVSFALP